MTAYDDIRRGLEQQRFYANKHGKGVYEFQGISIDLFSFSLRTPEGEELEVGLSLEGLKDLHPIQGAERKRMLKKFGLGN